jgi:hypothetical protein
MPSLTIWTRLEPRCRSSDMGTALEARTHDPFWLLARQWQLGELLGDDAGSPIIASVTSVDMPLDRYAGPDGVVSPMPESTPLESWIEREGARPSGPVVDYRQSAESGLQFLLMLRAAKMDQYVPGFLAEYGIAAPSSADLSGLDTRALRLAQVVAQRVPDGVRLAADLRVARPGLPAKPVVAASDRPIVLGVAGAFLGWHDALFDEPATVPASAAGASEPPPPSTAWVQERMEYAFVVDSSRADTPGAFVAGQYTGGPLDWTSFDFAKSPLGPVTSAPAPVSRSIMPTPVGFKGMPARRFWQMEDAAVDLGAIEAGPTDLGRLMLREFALTYGNDWFVVPLPVRVGSLARIVSLVVTDTFGVSQTIPHYSQTPDGGRWRMFAISGEPSPHRLLLPQTLPRTVPSDPIERVLLVRDEAANMAWAIEMIVTGASGAPVDRSSAAAPAQPPDPSLAAGTAAALRYQLGTAVPACNIPFVPALIDTVQRRMRRAAFLRTDGTPGILSPLGRVLSIDVPLFEEEFAREGIKIERRYRLARWIDGSTHLWVARRKQTGATAGSSGLQFDRLVE